MKIFMTWCRLKTARWILVACFLQVLISSAGSQCTPEAPNPNGKILIIGAGAAGIAAATRLYEKGFRNVQILEANNRIGGRLNTVPFGANIVELGAQWCHGETGNAVFGLANPLGLLESSLVAEENTILQSNGELLPEEITDRLTAAADEIMESEEIDSYYGTLADYFTERYEKVMASAEMSDIDSELAQKFLVVYRNGLEGLIAIDSWYSLSAAGSSYDETCEGNNDLSWVYGGYKSVLDIMMKKHPAQLLSVPIPIESKIKLNKFVTNIQWNKGPGNPATVSCADGSQYEADHVIVTCSIGVLKENLKTMFTPELPIVKQNAIKGINLGTVNKIFMEFKTPFWRGKGNFINLMWDPTELETLKSSKYAWASGVTTFYRVDHQPNLLVAWMIGPEGRKAELLDDETVIEGMMVLLRKFFKNNSLPRPVNMIRSKWSSNPNFRGSYSSRSFETERLNTGASKLARPVLDCSGAPELLFAGEASEPRYYGNVHGAIESGWREADRLVKYFNGAK